MGKARRRCPPPEGDGEREGIPLRSGAQGMLPENREEKEGLPDDRPQKPRYWTRGRILRRLLLLFGLYLGLCAGLAWLNVRPQRLKMPAPPARSDLRFESVS